MIADGLQARLSTVLWAGALVLTACAAEAAEGARRQANPGWSWRKVEQPKGVPTLCFESAVTFDRSVGRLVVFGGHGQGYSGSQRDETWLYDPASNRWTNPEPPNRPIGACCVREMVYDPANRRSFYFGGHSFNHGWQWRAPRLRGGGMPWAYDASANTWRPAKPFAHRAGKPVTGAVYHGEHQVMVLYGGEGFYDTTVWVYDGYSNTWTALKRVGEGPTYGGHCPPMIYDPERRVILMYGHGYGKDVKDGLWAYDLKRNAWRGFSDANRPKRKGWAMMVYDPLNRMPILFTPTEKSLTAFGYDRRKNAWRRLPAKGAPPPPYTVQQGAYDPVRHQTIFANGGSYNVKNRPATYIFGHLRPEERPSVLAAPGDLKVVVTKTGTAELTFKPVRGATRCVVYRGTGEQPWTVTCRRVGRTEAARFTDTGLKRNTIHYYYVRATDASGREGTASLKVRTQPRAPAQPVVSVLDKGSIEIAWRPSGEADVVGYNLYTFTGQKRSRYSVRATGLTRVNRKLLTEARYVHQTAAGDQAGARYLVRAVNRLEVESGPSPWAATFPSEPTGLCVRREGGRVVVLWQPSPEKGLKGYNVYRKDSRSGLDAKKIAGPIRDTRLVDRSKTGQGACKYYITAVDVLGREGAASHGAWLDDNGRN